MGRAGSGRAVETDARDQDADYVVVSVPGSQEHRGKMQVLPPSLCAAECVLKVNCAEEEEEEFLIKKRSHQTWPMLRL